MTCVESLQRDRENSGLSISYHSMHLTPFLLSIISKRLVPAVYGISLKGVHVQPQFQIEHTPGDCPAVTSEVHCQVGEDAAFVSMGPSSRFHVCGVADGVGGWIEKDVDPSFFSKVLMESCCRVSTRESVDLKKPVDILTRALSDVKSFHSKFYGGSTACVLSLDTASGILYTANIGDSGYLVYRDGKILAESQTLTHYFNCPYQLSNPPPGFNTTQIDRPSAAVSTSIDVEEGDLIVLASDGLFHNMYKSELTKMLRDFKSSEQADLDNMVKKIVEKTHKYSTDSSYMSPFAQTGSQMLSWEFQGGKLEDITVLLAAVTNSSTLSS